MIEEMIANGLANGLILLCGLEKEGRTPMEVNNQVVLFWKSTKIKYCEFRSKVNLLITAELLAYTPNQQRVI
jgi:hypothetical protein